MGVVARGATYHKRVDRMKTAADIIDDLIRREGSTYSDHPADRGGPTKYGITLRTLRAWRHRIEPSQITDASDVEALTEEEARAIYTAMYVINPRFIELNDVRLQALLVDCGVQHGTERATRWLQEALGVKVDGDLGPLTLAAANASSRAHGLMRDRSEERRV